MDQPPATPHVPTGKPRRSRAYLQALDIEQSLLKAILDPKTIASARASCAVAWTRVQDAKRILRNKPLPGQLRPELEQLRKARRSGSLIAVPVQVHQDPPAPASAAGSAG